MKHRKMAEDCWRLIQALSDTEVKLHELDGAAIKLIEMACDAAAESQRIADGHPPKGLSHDSR